MSDTNPVTVKDLDELTEKIFKKREEIDGVELILKGHNKELLEMKTTMALYLTELGRTDYKTPAGTVYTQEMWTVTKPVTPEDAQLLKDWLTEKGIADQYLTVNHQSLNALYRVEFEKAKESGDPMLFSIPGIQPAKLFRDIRFRKA